METPVVHVRAAAYDVYIGRGRCPLTGARGRWGNPYSHKEGTRAQYKVDTVEEAIAGYRRHLWAQLKTGAVTLQDLAALQGRTLGCWCKPRPCHGDVLAAAAEWAHQRLNDEAPASN